MWAKLATCSVFKSVCIQFALIKWHVQLLLSPPVEPSQDKLLRDEIRVTKTLSLYFVLVVLCNGMVLFHTQPLLPYCPTAWNGTLPPQHINNLIAASRLTVVWSVVTMPQSPPLPPLPPSPLFAASHTLACHLLFVPATHHTFLCPLC